MSVWYNGGKARAPMLSPITETSADEWRRDLQQIKSLGFSTVRGWIDWSHNEPVEGRYDFDNLRLLCKLANEVGLKVFVQIYTGWDGFGFAPDWARKKFPDAFFNESIIRDVSAPPSTSFYSDHSGIRQAILKFLTEAAKVAIQFPNFCGWDLWSEPRPMRLVGPETHARYREWLSAKYKSLDALNREWYETYRSWEDVYAQRTGGIGTYAMDIDWNDFVAQKGAEDMAMQYAAIRKVDKSHVITSHASPPSVFGRQLDDFLQAESLDYYGLSIYPRYVGEPSLWRMIMGADFSRCANRRNGGFYAGEFQAGFSTNSLRVGDPVTPGDHRTWVFSLLAKGARGIHVYAYYVMSSGVESGGFGLVGLDGKVTERARELGRLARLVDENKELFLRFKPVEAEIALVYNPSAQLVGGARGSPVTTPGRGDTGNYYQDSLMGYYRAFAENNIPIDFIHRRDLESADLSRYKLIIFPCPIILTPQAAAGLKKYVGNGGFVLSEARLAWNSEHAYTADVIPGMGLSDVFGIQETKTLTRNDVRIIIDDNSHPALARLKKGDELKGAQFAESVEPLAGHEVRVLGRLDDGTACLTASTFGKGQTLFLGSFLGLANQTTANRNNNQFLLNLLDWARIERPVTTSQDGADPETPVEVRLHQDGNGYLLFIINHGKTARPLTVELKVQADKQYVLNDIVHQEAVQKTSQARTLTFSTPVGEKDVRVWHIRAASD
jgi:beta-galactosidase